MKNLKYILSIVFLSVLSYSFAQNTLFSNVGTIQYDKTMYLKNIVKKQFMEKASQNEKQRFEYLLNMTPENYVLKKTLNYNQNKTLFFPTAGATKDPKISQVIMMLALDLDATTYSNLQTNEYKRYNDLVGEKFIIQDSLKKINWHITDEYREIAGYVCRRANGFTPDSIYVIGFYANEIPVSGGPESVNGLPGMILGLVIPSQHVSYFATKVEFTNAVDMSKESVFDQKKVKVLNREQTLKQFTETFKNFLNPAMVEYVMKLILM